MENEELKNTAPEAAEIKGAFLTSLVRNNSKIKQDRAIAIGEDAQLLYKRKVEDLDVAIKRMKRDQENMLDLSPTNSMSLIVASDFKGEEYVKKDLELSVEIRNSEIELDIARRRYLYLFGEI